MKLNDIKPTEEVKFGFVRGKKFANKIVENTVRIFLVGILIIFAFNVFGIYIKKQNAEKEIMASVNSSMLGEVDTILSTFEKVKSDLLVLRDGGLNINPDKGLSKTFSHGFEAIEYTGEAAENLSEILVLLENLKQANIAKDPVTEDLAKIIAEIELASEKISKAKLAISEMNLKILPAEVAKKIESSKTGIETLELFMSELADYGPQLLTMLGHEKPMRYLVLQQNNNEIRPTGGFIGSYLTLELDKGVLKNLQTHDVYDIPNEAKNIVSPPDELSGFIDNWTFRDSNFSPDFSLSARKAIWFLQKAGQPRIDIVVSINQSSLKDFLQITGPIEVPGFATLDAENYNLILTYAIESKLSGAQDPKMILKSFVPLFMEKIFKPENLTKIGGVFLKDLRKKDLMFYAREKDLQALFEKLNVAGRNHNLSEKDDYVSVVHASIGGNKSDYLMEEKIEHSSQVSKDGEIIDELIVSRKHLWDDTLIEDWLKILAPLGVKEINPSIIDVMGRGRNRMATRIFIPKDAELIESNIENAVMKYDEDLDKNYLSFVFEVEPGQEKVANFKYKLPFVLNLKNGDTYNLIAEKQPGSYGSVLTKYLYFDKKVKLGEVFPKEVLIQPDSSAIFATNLSYDRVFRAVLSR